MKKLKLLLPVLMSLLLAGTGCNNSGNEAATNNDSTAADTIKSDPSKFSDPH